MAWVYLSVAGLFEIGWVLGMKYSDGFSKPLPALASVACMAISFGGLLLALKGVPMGTAYAVWTGIGAVGVALAGIWLFGETATPVRLGCIALVVIGIAGLKLAPA